MDRDEEMDLYIKSKLKDNQVPEKIDNLFNNSIKLIENERGMNMNENNVEQKKNSRKFLNRTFMQRIVAFAACAVIALGGGQIYASTQGYDNIFFMIKYLITGDETVITGKNEILSDRDMSISYEPINITPNVAMLIRKLQVKENQATLILQLRENDINEKMTYLGYVVKDENGNKLFSNLLNYGDVNEDGEINSSDLNDLSTYVAKNEEQRKEEKISNNADVNKDGLINLKDVTILQRYLAEIEGYETLPYIQNNRNTNTEEYTENLILQGLKNDTKKLTLEIYNSDSRQILKLNIDLEKRIIDVEGEDEALEKISEIELKEFLGYMPLIYDGDGTIMNDDWKIWVAVIVGNHLPGYELERFEIGGTRSYGYKVKDINLILDNIFGMKIVEFEENDENDFSIYEKNGENYFVTTYVAGLPGVAECIDITNISYSGGLYTVTYTYCESDDMAAIFEIDINDYDIYEQTVIFELNKDENAISKFRRVSSQSPIIIKSKENKEEGVVEDNTTDIEQPKQEENNESINEETSKVDNYASTMSWTEYWAPGIKIKYPTIFNLNEVGGFTRGCNQGEISTTITGIAKGIDPDTKEIIESNLKINIYEPIYREVVDENWIKNKSGYTNSKGMKWCCIDHNSEKEEYVYYSDNWEYRIQFTWEGQGSYKIINIINWVLASTETGSY